MELFYQPDHHRGFAVSTRRQVADHHHRYRCAPALDPEAVKQTNSTAHRAIQPRAGEAAPTEGIHPTRCVQSLTELHFMKLGVNTTLFKQVRMAAAFNDHAIFHHHDFVSLFDGRQTVRDNQRGTVFL